MGEILIGVLLIILCIAIYLQSGSFPNFNEVHLNAGSFPKLIVILLAALSLVMIALKVKELIQQKNGQKRVLSNTLKTFFTEYKLVIATFFTLFLYVILMQYIGFLVSTIAFIIITALLIGPKTKKDILITVMIAVFITLGTYYFFQNFLYVRFPAGFIF